MEVQTEPVIPSPPTSFFTGEMCIIDRTGDTKVIWDAKNEAEVDAARATFDALKAKGYLAYSVSKDGSQGEVIHAFDPKAEKLILSPAMQGG